MNSAELLLRSIKPNVRADVKEKIQRAVAQGRLHIAERLIRRENETALYIIQVREQYDLNVYYGDLKEVYVLPRVGILFSAVVKQAMPCGFCRESIRFPARVFVAARSDLGAVRVYHTLHYPNRKAAIQALHTMGSPRVGRLQSLARRPAELSMPIPARYGVIRKEVQR